LKLTPGARLRSTVCGTEVVVVRAPEGNVDLTCCGAPMVDRDDGDGAGWAPGAAPTAPGEGVLIGKRYSDQTSGIEVLCTKAGSGPLAYDGRPLAVNAPKPLPSSD
jgi:hypothetical protein